MKLNYNEINTLGELKKAGYQSKSIKDELRDNLRDKIKNGEETFVGVWGYENSVIPELERAILSRHNINLLGLRGQAKTRLARLMVNLLDENIPVVGGSEINDDPLKPMSRYAIELIKDKGDATPITWLHRSERFSEKLATPDVTVADLIGDVDPIKAANLKLSYADDRVIHFGMIPRANRCIFVINELPDLQARIQVSLFNILQEGDIQIRGFKLRLPLDIQFVFTANPEDYTNRGSIVTPLKDRIGSQILTHYPEDIATARKITEQESKLDTRQTDAVYVPDIAKDLLEQISFEARESEYVDAKSGVSARTSITAFENLLSTAERRALLTGADSTMVRLSDFLGIIPSITGKIELVYEGEQEGADGVAAILIDDAVKTLFPTYFPEINKLEKKGEETPYDELLHWFFEGDGFELLDEYTDEEYKRALDDIPALNQLLKEYQPEYAEKDVYFLKEVLLWGLVAYKKLNKNRFEEGYQFKDMYSSFFTDL
ncbi:magnesium chelatase, subunit ChlI family protein [Cellulophaga algicola DSM 14237]|uniref:Magnesium chelatase, subunit ChlI family protein n=1 Tax=Cellulophaga algicola (strain DSM 14237 / IC166 / ACAM 630) TaxID=688270 RepID=E6XEQ7_CELAD|nr:magnesium chelatase [Cellulophaga algicola]ADV51385.1 magnesium chelatase, subunit ChlI family protein [Cellulophaga algicola DSM 14237]